MARKRNTTLRSLTEEGLTRVLEEQDSIRAAPIQPVTFRGKGLSDAYRDGDWSRIRAAAYEGRGA